MGAGQSFWNKKEKSYRAETCYCQNELKCIYLENGQAIFQRLMVVACGI